MYSTDEDLNKLVKDGWNPLADNSDAFRLAADLKINVMFLSWAVKAKLHNSEYETDWIDYGRFNGGRNSICNCDCCCEDCMK